MKKLMFLIATIALSFSLSAQKSVVTSAWSYLKDGFLDDAKKSIDKAEQHQSTKDWYKTHYFKGMIYQEIGISENPRYKSLCTNCLDISYDAYIKAIQLNFVNPEYKNLDLTTEVGLMKFVGVLQKFDERDYESTESLVDMISNRLPALSNAFINQGVAKYYDSDFERAYENFEKATMISALSFKVDTQLYYFASLAALKAKKFEEAINYNETLIQLGFGANDDEKVAIYQSQAVAYRETGDTAKMLKVLEKGIEAFPKANYPLVIETFNYYVNIGENEKAFEYINLAIEKNPNDAQFYVIRGTLLEEMKRKDEAKLDYVKAVELQSDNFDANYSLGAFYYNTAVDTLDWADKNIPINKFSELGKYQEISNQLFEEALPFLEKAYAIQEKNVNVLSTLKTIYYRLGKQEQYNEVDEKLKSLIE
ncbi:MAG TPA: hypothetical protein PLG05_02910 [Bacteroidales bacterium]|nr:hypothetical protein [Bacteroidales bacterium]HPL04106.1 hypothetical protein [Bacteroidales bacterium]HPX75966.1 hypothetical protein [Bacteroidales bacterium]HQB21832.1 hypothetical protein [Bacteroidales bacterium]